MYFEFPTPEFEVTIDKNKTIGASFIEKSALKGFKVINNVIYAQPGVKALKYDVYSPNDAKNLPCIVIIHGGGWSINCEDVMRGLARELVRDGKYVVASVDYRWIGNQDGDAKTQFHGRHHRGRLWRHRSHSGTRERIWRRSEPHCRDR